MNNQYLPFASEILEIIQHTPIEYTFRMAYEGDVKPGQFFEVSLPKYGEAPISVSGIGDGTVDLTIRNVGKVTGEIFEYGENSNLYMRGPYGNGFDLDLYRGKDLLIVAGGTGLSPVRGVVDYFAENPDQVKSLTLIAGFKSMDDILFRDDLERWRKTSNVILTIDAGEATTYCQIGFVTEHIPRLEYDDYAEIFAIVVGPPIMMRCSCEALIGKGFTDENIWISQERKMSCGIGKCGHCKINDSYVCLDGPVYNYVQGRDLND